jgi:hypothetical protein
MKTSRRFLLGTLLAALALPVLIVVYHRVTTAGGEFVPPQRTPATDLDALRDFSSVTAEGDFALEVHASDSWAVDYEPLGAQHGNFAASVENGTLHLRGHGNRTETQAARVRVGLPRLVRVEARDTFTLAVRDFEGEQLDVRLTGVSSALLANNRLGNLTVAGGGVETLRLEGNRLGASSLKIFGVHTISVSD